MKDYFSAPFGFLTWMYFDGKLIDSSGELDRYRFFASILVKVVDFLSGDPNLPVVFFIVVTAAWVTAVVACVGIFFNDFRTSVCLEDFGGDRNGELFYWGIFTGEIDSFL